MFRGNGQDWNLKKLRLGDPSHWRAVYVQFHRLILFILRRLGIPDAEIEDAAQDVWIKVVTGIDGLGDDSTIRHNLLKAWIAQVARNSGIDRVRKRGREPPTQPFDDLGDDREDCDPSRDTVSLSDFSYAGLTEIEKRVLLLRLEGRNYEEIARMIEKSVSTAHKIYERAIEKMRRANGDFEC